LTAVSAFALPKPGAATSPKDYRIAIEKSRQSQPTPPSQFNTEIGPLLDAAVLKALALEHDKRFHDGGELLESLLPIDVTDTRQATPAEASMEVTMDIPMFSSEEYRTLASSGRLSKDDLEVLWDLYCDLETPISTEVKGIFSPVTVSGFTKTELASLDGKSISDWLFAEQTSIAELRMMKDIGKMFLSNPVSARASRSGRLIYAAAIARSLEKFGERISALPFDQYRELCQHLLKKAYLPRRYRSTIENVQSLLV
jgi:hypothetical protein